MTARASSRARAAVAANGKPPPHDPEIEQTLLGVLFWAKGEALRALLARIAPEDFYVSDHQRCLRVLAKMAEEGLDPEPARALFRQRAPDLERLLAECAAKTPGSTDPAPFVRLLKAAARARRYLELAYTLEAEARDPKRWSQLDQRMIESLELLGPPPEEVRPAKPFAASLVLASQVQPKAVEWLWYPYIPRGKITFLTGDPGDGKTLFAVWLASYLTRGRAFPGHELDPEAPIQGDVVYMTNEDGIEDTMVPRLEAAAAELDRITFLKGATRTDEKGTREIDITLTDLEVLEDAIVKRRPVLLVVDPVQAFIDPSVDMNRANEVRGQLRRLVELSDRHRMTILSSATAGSTRGSGTSTSRGSRGRSSSPPKSRSAMTAR